MPKPVYDLHLDFETYCDLDLKKVGIHRYAAHPSFRVLCVAWKLQGVLQTAVRPMPAELAQALRHPSVRGHAWNAAFETAVLARLGVVPANPLSCTMQRALSYGLPAKLETAAAALVLQRQKDMPGHRLMLKMSRPLKPGSLTVWEAADYQRLADY